MKKLLFLNAYQSIILAFLLIGCSPKLVPQVQTITKDSIVYQTKDRPVYIAGERVTVHDTIKCPKGEIPLDFAIEKKQGRAEVKEQLKKGVFTVDCKCDSIVANVKDSIIKSYHSKETVKTITKIEYKVHWIDKFCRWFTLIVILLLSAYVYFKFKPNIVGMAKNVVSNIFKKAI